MKGIEPLSRRVDALEEGTGPITDDFADMVMWVSAGCPDSWRLDLYFEKQMAELAENIKEDEMG
jgi:hypothetical protein